MSRIGRLPVPVPAGVDVTIDGQDVKVKGPKGELALTVTEPISVTGSRPIRDMSALLLLPCFSGYQT